MKPGINLPVYEIDRGIRILEAIHAYINIYSKENYNSTSNTFVFIGK